MYCFFVEVLLHQVSQGNLAWSLQDLNLRPLGCQSPITQGNINRKYHILCGINILDILDMRARGFGISWTSNPKVADSFPAVANTAVKKIICKRKSGKISDEDERNRNEPKTYQYYQYRESAECIRLNISPLLSYVKTKSY